MNAREKALAALGEMEERAKKATPGPWHPGALSMGIRHLERNCDWYFTDPATDETIPDPFGLPGRQDGDGGQRDGDFIAHVRIDAPLAYDALRGVLELHVGREPHMDGSRSGACQACRGLPCPTVRIIAERLGGK